MTDSTVTASRYRERSSAICAIGLLICAVMIGVVLPEEMTEYVKTGAELAVRCVLPSSFPFMIFSDIYVHYGSPERLRVISCVLSHTLGISRRSVGAVIAGGLCGFPIGAKITAELYLCGAISRSEAERVMALSSNPSCAFTVGAVGLGMYGDLRIGIILLASVYTSTVIGGLVTKSNCDKTDFSNDIIQQRYNFVSSVKSAGSSAVSMISFISIFSVIVGLIKNHIKILPIQYAMCALAEVTNAVKMFSSLSVFYPALGISLCGFSLGFGGLSVMMQSAVFTENTDLRLKKYISIKLLIGLICAAISTAVFSAVY